MSNTEHMKKSIDYAMTFDGMTTEMALKLIAVFFDNIEKDKIKNNNNYIELGTYKGRVCALLGMLSVDGRLTLIDAANYLEEDKLNKENIRYNFYQEKSEKWLEEHKNSGPYIISHHDASHYFDNVKTELLLLNSQIDTSGLMILDDFTDPFNQVRAAYYWCRYVGNIDFEIIMIGFGKAILCHKNKFNDWEEFILNKMQNNLRILQLDTTIYRTDINEHSRAFSIQKKQSADMPDRYGIQTWGERFYKKS